MRFIPQGKINLKYILIIVIIIAIIGGGVLVWQRLSIKKELTGEKEEAPLTEEKEKESMAGEEEDISEIVLENPETKVAPLTAVDESNSSGAAYKLFKDGKLYLVVMATMPNLQEGNAYEGWLVNPDPLHFFSTGIMQKTEEGIWLLEYTADDEYPLPYNKVMITEETIVDGQPETHIVEGDF